jgi:choline dehydrogenase-like flavoprotein
MSKNIDVVMIDGGYTGVMAANRLTQHDDVTVTVINPRARSSSRGWPKDGKHGPQLLQAQRSDAPAPIA